MERRNHTATESMFPVSITRYEVQVLRSALVKCSYLPILMTHQNPKPIFDTHKVQIAVKKYNIVHALKDDQENEVISTHETIQIR